MAVRDKATCVLLPTKVKGDRKFLARSHGMDPAKKGKERGAELHDENRMAHMSKVLSWGPT